MKKLILSAIAASVAATGFAGSYAAPAAQPASAQSAYVELDGGYALTNNIPVSASEITTLFDHPTGAFAGGIAAGYHFMPNLGVEAGFLMPVEKTKLKATGATISEYSFYGAARLNANVADNIDVFALAGLGYTHQHTSATIVTSDDVASVGNDSGFGFAGGVGADYTVANNFVIGAKYLRLPGRDRSTTDEAPFVGPQYFLVSVGYKFGM
jgi:opacity protein-like surface antigen